MKQIQISTVDGRYIAVAQNVTADYIDAICKEHPLDVVDILEQSRGLVELTITSDLVELS